MDVIYPRCGGLDLGKDILVAAIRIQAGSSVTSECRTYGTTKAQISRLVDWLSGNDVTHVVMEATGSYWKSIWRGLEPHFVLTLANPAQVRSMTGRKTDVRDARRLADFHAHGLVRGSFVPPPEIDGLRALTRTRKQLVQEITRHTQRIQKILDVANIKITGLITDVLGVSGRAMVKALIAGESDLHKLAALAHPRLTASPAKLVEALDGTLTDDDRWLLGMHLRQVEGLEQEIVALDERIGKAVDPFRELVDRIEQMPGMSDVSTPALLAEIGIDMSKFPRHGHLVSWARICPRNDESAGKIQSRRILKGSRWIKALMTQAAWAASRKKDSYYRAQFLRLCRTTDKKRAIVAVAASMLTAIYYMIRDRTPYRDLGFQYFDTCDRTKAARRLVSRLKTLGYGVQITG